MASADFSFALTKEPSPGKVLFLSLHTVRLYLARLDGLWASLRPASLPPVRGLSADSCSYGQRFVPRFLQLGRAACAPRLPPCGSLRLPPSVPVSTLQLTRNSPCWAHWRGPPDRPRRPPGRPPGRRFCPHSPPALGMRRRPARTPVLPARGPRHTRSSALHNHSTFWKLVLDTQKNSFNPNWMMRIGVRTLRISPSRVPSGVNCVELE